jgi:hypothetical protein
MSKRSGLSFSFCLLLTALGIGAPLPALAGVVNDVPSCYKANHIEPAGGIAYDRLIYVLIDQTVSWNSQLEHSLVNNLNRDLKPGTKFVVAEFSAFSQGRYLQVIHTGILEKPLTQGQENNTAIPKVKAFKACLRDQGTFARNMADTTAVSVMKQSTSTLDQSDIMAAIKQVSLAMRSDPAHDKVFLIASDGLENSSVTSFYGHGGVRNINPGVEIRKAAAADMFGDFGGAHVYFLGGALMPPAKNGSLSARNGYRDPQVLHNLSMFWHEYFSKSDAKLIEFGEPTLLVPVHF